MVLSFLRCIPLVTHCWCKRERRQQICEYSVVQCFSSLRASTVNQCGHSDMVLALTPDSSASTWGHHLLPQHTEWGVGAAGGALSCEKSWEPDSVRAVPWNLVFPICLLLRLGWECQVLVKTQSHTADAHSFSFVALPVLKGNWNMGLW